MAENRQEKIRDLHKRINEMARSIERVKGILAYVKSENAKLSMEKAYFQQLSIERGKQIKTLQAQLDRKPKSFH